MKILTTLFALAFTTHSAFAENPRTIVHNWFFQDGKLVNGQIYGTLHLTGLFDRPTSTDWGDFQFRLKSSEGWQAVTPTSSPVATSLRSSNWRRFSVAPVPTTGIEFRVCHANEPCSVPYEFKPQAIFGKFLSTSASAVSRDNVVTAMKRNLRFTIRNHQAGNIQFQIGKLKTSGDLGYEGYTLAEIPKGCPEVKPGDPFACEVRIPDPIIAVPGVYTLSATTDYGSSQNTMEFEVMPAYKVIATFPDHVRFRLQNIITLNFAGGDVAPSDVEAVLYSPNPRCQNRKVPLQRAGVEQLNAILPPACMPLAGSGDLFLDVISRDGGQQRLTLPYTLEN